MRWPSSSDTPKVAKVRRARRRSGSAPSTEVASAGARPPLRSPARRRGRSESKLMMPNLVTASRPRKKTTPEIRGGGSSCPGLGLVDQEVGDAVLDGENQ